jgi:hypothetical protein
MIDGFNPVMAMLDLIHALEACRDSGCECATDDDVEAARDVIAWLTSELSERKMRARSRRPNRQSKSAVQGSSPPPVLPSSPAPVRHQSNGQSTAADCLSLSLRSESDSSPKSLISEEETSQESAGARVNGLAVHEQSGAAVQQQSTTAVHCSSPAQQSDDDALLGAMVLVWDPTGGVAMSGSYRSSIRALVPFMRQAGAQRGQEPAACWAAASARFKADPGIKRGRYGLPTFLNQLERWLDPDEPQRRKGAPVPVSANAEFETESDDFAALVASAKEREAAHG